MSATRGTPPSTSGATVHHRHSKGQVAKLRQEEGDAAPALPTEPNSAGEEQQPKTPELRKQYSADQPVVEMVSTTTSSLLDGSSNIPPMIIACTIGMTWILSVMLDAWAEGRLAAEWSLLFSLVNGLPTVLAINTVGLAFVFFAWVLPRLAQHGLPHIIAIAVYAICSALLILAPPYVLWRIKANFSPLLGASVTMQSCVFIMKAHSYFFAAITDPSSISDPAYSITKFFRFLWLPTLVWKKHFPKSKEFRIGFFLQNFVLAFLSFLAIYMIVLHFLIPTLANFRTLGLIRMWVHLIIPAQLLFFIAFYGLFHCFLNCTSEVFFYADREFYNEWWAATDYGEWTRKWNRTVQNWTASVYMSLRKRRFSRVMSTFLVVFMSSMWHDFIMSISLQQLSFWHMIFMQFQFVLIVLSRTAVGDHFRDTVFGAIFVTLTQPVGLALMMCCYGICRLEVDSPVCMPADLYRVLTSPFK